MKDYCNHSSPRTQNSEMSVSLILFWSLKCLINHSKVLGVDIQDINLAMWLTFFKLSKTETLKPIIRTSEEQTKVKKLKTYKTNNSSS